MNFIDYANIIYIRILDPFECSTYHFPLPRGKAVALVDIIFVSSNEGKDTWMARVS